MKLTRETVSKISYKSKVVQVADWGGIEVCLRELSVGNFQKYQEAMLKDGGMDDVESAVKLLQMSICDESGKLIFNDPEGAAMLLEQGVSGLLFLAKEVASLNGMDHSPELEVEQAAENFN